MADWKYVPLKLESWEGPSDVFTRSSSPITLPLPARPAVSSPRQAFFEEKLKEIAWVLGGSRVPVQLDFQGERRQLDKGCIGHAIANGALLEPHSTVGELEFVELASGATADALEGPQLWKDYAREEIPSLFGLEFNAGSWQQGFLVQGANVFLLVTLDKSEHAEDYQYDDGFESPTSFRWQSQNRTTQASRHGQIISGALPGYSLHLFVRPARLQNGKAGRFTYFGGVEAEDLSGEQPISVSFNLDNAVPARLWKEFTVPAA